MSGASFRILAARALFALAVVASLASLPAAIGRGVDSDLASLLAGERGELVREISCGAAAGATLLASAPTEEGALALAARLAEELSIPATDPKEAFAELAAHGAGLLSDSARRAISEGRAAEVRDASLARLFGPEPRLAPLSLDPMLLVSDFAAAAAAGAPGWSGAGGFPTAEAEGRHVAMLGMRASSRTAEEWAALAARFRDEAARGGPERVDCAGAVFHSSLAAERTRRELNVLSAFSVAIALLLGFALFRSWRFLPALVAAEVSSFAVATAALFAYAGRPHAVVFVFGTALIGLSVDYVYHALSARRPIARELVFSALTTAAAFAPLAFAPAATLREMAVFTISGIFTVLAFVLLMPRRAAVPAEEAPSAPWRTIALPPLSAAVVVLAAAAAFVAMKPSCEPTAFHRPDPFLARGERLLAELNGAAGELVYVRADDLQTALEREEALGVHGVSAIVPSLARQRENRALKERLYREVGKDFEALSGVKTPERVEGPALDAGALESPALRSLVETAWTGRGLVSPVRGPAPEGALVVSPKRTLGEMLREFTRSVRALAGVSLVAALGALAFFFRRRAAAGTAPLAASVIGALAATFACGIEPTAFTMMAILILAGLGADYTVFHASSGGDAITRRAVLCSFLTSFAGLGALAFTDFETTRSMGVAFAGGLPAAYLVSRFVRFGRRG